MIFGQLVWKANSQPSWMTERSRREIPREIQKKRVVHFIEWIYNMAKSLGKKLRLSK
jgi:hypothetical protein